MKDKVRVVNNSGIGHETEVTWADSGETVPHLRAIDIHASVGKVVTADLTFIIPTMDVKAVPRLSAESRQDLHNLIELMKRIDGTEEPEKKQ